MSDIPNGSAGLNNDNSSCNRISEAVCVDTARVYDSCADKDCLSDLRVFFTGPAQAIIDRSSTVRCRSCEVLNVFSEIEKVPFSSGYYSVDATFFFMVALDAFSSPSAPPQTVYGLSVYSKKVILYGAEGSVKVFSSEYSPAIDTQNIATSTNPRAKIQVATPICLEAKLCRPCDCCCSNQSVNSIPSSIRNLFAGDFIDSDASQAVRATIGLFSIVQLERDVQILIPAYDFCMPSKECSNQTEDPCEAFRRISFPVSEFFPPEQSSSNSNGCSDLPLFTGGCGCGK
ncbi:MAG: hypothetical protein J1E34_06775 [Oscillospiraceae bacterium]|nr:hypothetical protein [Oscillospiraceae bacterium]